MSSTARPARILLVEDEDADVRLIEATLRDARIDNELELSHDAEDAWQRLEAGLLPDLILLDIYLPGMSGRELLQRIRANEAHRQIPVVMLTTSRDADDVQSSFDNDVASYLYKPVDAAAFIDAVRRVDSLRFRIVTRPAEG